MHIPTLHPLNAPILLVGDSPRRLRLLEIMLTRAGYRRVAAVTDPAELAATYQHVRPLLVVLDLRVPSGARAAVIEQLHGLTRRPPPVMVVTEDGTLGNRQQALRDGAAETLPLPFDRHDLLTRVGAVLARVLLMQRVRALQRLQRRTQQQVA